MKAKTSELVGPALDYAVALCGTVPPKTQGFRNKDTLQVTVYLDQRCDWKGNLIAIPYSPSTDWAIGGQIIEREGIDLYCSVPTNIKHDDPSWTGSWRAKYHRCGFGTEMFYGKTALIAAMRCFVTTKLGDEIELPDWLVGASI